MNITIVVSLIPKGLEFDTVNQVRNPISSDILIHNFYDNLSRAQTGNGKLHTCDKIFGVLLARKNFSLLKKNVYFELCRVGIILCY